MSEPTFPFEGQQVADAPPVEAEPKSRRTALLALGGLAAAAVLGVAGYFLVFAGGDDAQEAAAPVSRPPATQPEAPDAADQPVAQPRISDKSFGRDPFEPLIVEQAVVSAPAPDSTTGDPATGPAPVTGTVVPPPTTTTPVESEDHVFQVLAVADSNSWITVEVDGKRYKHLQAGEVFATYFKVLVIGGSTNAFQFGDDTFTLTGKKPIHLAN